MTPRESLGRRAARVVAQAKVNLFLRVLAREASGFHQLETLFQRIELGDDVTVRVGDGGGDALDCRGADVGPVERNLAWRAAHAYRARAGWPAAFAIEIDKRIPVGGGLGGGSADAGAVLRCLNALAPSPLAPAHLLALAAPLGSDVPFLTAETPLALAWGRGERMLALPPLPASGVVLLFADGGVATRDAFQWLAESRGGDAPEPRVWSPDDFATWEAVTRVSHNDFESVVFARRPDLALAFDGLRAGERATGRPRLVRMTGSGATLFRVLHDLPPDAVFYSDGALSLDTRSATRVAAVEVSD